MIKGSIQEEYITIINIHVPNIGAPKYTKQILMDIKGKIDSKIVGDFKPPLCGQIIQTKKSIRKHWP